jgi:hypothetical protein
MYFYSSFSSISFHIDVILKIPTSYILTFDFLFLMTCSDSGEKRLRIRKKGSTRELLSPSTFVYSVFCHVTREATSTSVDHRRSGCRRSGNEARP